MRFYISFGILDLKYLKYCALLLIVQIYICLLFLLDDKNKKILQNHILLNPSCLFLGLLLNFIPSWIIQKKNNQTLNIYITNLMMNIYQKKKS